MLAQSCEKDDVELASRAGGEKSDLNDCPEQKLL